MPCSALKIFDAEFALNQFSGNQSLLVQILEKFTQQYENFNTLLTEHLEQDNFYAAKQQIHTLKGVSGNLGMKALDNACKELEVNLSKPTSEYNFEVFLQVFKQTLKVVQDYATNSAITESPTVVPKQNNKTALITALKRNEFISESKIQNYSTSLNLSAEKFNQLKQAINDLDYTSAIELLE